MSGVVNKNMNTHVENTMENISNMLSNDKYNFV